MRLWSLHPQFLDSKGLVALWREGLLALHVLRGQTKGYQHHPQLQRFREQENPVAALNWYLHEVVHEADSRGYRFDRTKLSEPSRVPLIPVTTGQLEYETKHLKSKLQTRDPKRFALYLNTIQLPPHPSFSVSSGDIAVWERSSFGKSKNQNQSLS